jgi:hypothetical protein
VSTFWGTVHCGGLFCIVDTFSRLPRRPELAEGLLAMTRIFVIPRRDDEESQSSADSQNLIGLNIVSNFEIPRYRSG